MADDNRVSYTGSQTSGSQLGQPGIQRVSAITRGTEFSDQQNQNYESGSQSSRKGSIKLTRNDLFVNDSNSASNTKSKASPIDNRHDQIQNLLDNNNISPSGDLDYRAGQFNLSPNAHLRRTFVDRTFSKLGKGSLRGSIFALCASAIGSGVLSLPYVLGLCGPGLGILFMLLGATAAEISLRMLAHLAVKHKMPNYSKIAIKAGGQGLNILLSVMILLFMFGSCISYQIIVTSLFKYVYLQFKNGDEFAETKLFAIYQSVPTALLLLLPLSLKRDMSAFRYVSLASIGALLYTGIVLIIELPKYYSFYMANQKEFNVKVQFGFFDFDMLTGCAMTFFAFQCQVQLLPIYSELVNPEYRRVVKVIDRAILVDLFFYMTIAVAGYLSSFNNTAKIVLERQQLPEDQGTPDYPILIAVIAVIGSILVAFPVAYNPFRQQFTQMFLKQETFTDKQNYLMTTIFILVTWAIAIVYPNIDKVLAIMGGLCAATLDYGIPMFCYVKLSEHKWTHPKNFAAIIFFGLLCCIGYGSVILTIFEMIIGCGTFKEYKNNNYQSGCPAS